MENEDEILMTDIAVIILTKNEKLHIGRCLEKLAHLDPRQIFIVDCFSSDGTQDAAKGFGAAVIEHEWPGNQAAQFQWALDNLPIVAQWVLRLDADEYLTDELTVEITKKLPRLEDGIFGVVLKRRHIVGWLDNRWIKYGMYPTKILRLFKTGRGRSDMKLMDEHIVVDGEVIEFDNDFVDNSLISFADWRIKHYSYARREALSYLSGEESTGEKAGKKNTYYKLPPYFRAFAYFCIRYFFKLGFLDGLAGFRWHFWQGLWYRWIVDREIGWMKKR